MNQWILSRARGQVSSRKRDHNPSYHPSADFEETGRYGELMWYGRAVPQMGLMLLFASVFFSGCVV